ncbi:hypothetical protein OHB00_13000 [Streptomyces sp. NBC_00631]|uniref:hypothetical protein n=1 Tax=Streptomyces sp. NBC_00631 TaxID=2975793 RepID=UPI0030DE5AC1
MDELLPSPAEVRCLLAQQVELRLYVLFELMNLPIENELVRQSISYRDERFLHKLRALVPAEELQRASRQGRLVLEDLIAARPYIETVYIMETARAIGEIQRLPRNAKAQGAAE